MSDSEGFSSGDDDDAVFLALHIAQQDNQASKRKWVGSAPGKAPNKERQRANGHERLWND